MSRKEELNSDIEKESGQVNADSQAAFEKELMADQTEESGDIVAKLESELTTSNDKYLRLYSEFENYKRRVAKERIEQSKMATADTLLSFIPIIDDLERALKSAGESKGKESINEGIKLIYSKIKNIATAKGLKEMESVGRPFDPELHDAIANIPAKSDDQKGKVMEEIEKGYFLNDKVIRHAKVIVGN